jgi:predicted secreted hydrolase
MPLDVQGWRLSLGDTITATMDDGPAVSLRLTDEKPPALHHGGYIDEGTAGGSYYYSRTRLSVTGELSGTPVTGLAWMDHQWGNFIVPSASIGGWDWYSLQLDDRSELMLYVLRGPTDSPVFGSLVHPDGQVEEVDPSAVHAEPLGHWTSPHTGAVYPSGWHITFPGHDLVLTPQLQDQELYFPEAPPGSVPTYWEGAVSITGSTTGQGYVELTGYAR